MLNWSYEDNVLGKPGFNPPYYFIVVRCVVWDETAVEVVYIVDDPAVAHEYYTHCKKGDSLTPREVLYTWKLQDSFGRDAEKFCKDKFEQAMTLSNVAEDDFQEEKEEP